MSPSRASRSASSASSSSRTEAMVSTDLAPGLYVQEDLGEPVLTALRTDIVAFVGIAERGPVDQPTPIASWEQFQATFGGFIPSGYLAYAVKAFFENGG